MRSDGRKGALALAVSIAVTGALYALPALHVLAWPMVLLSTLAHELGHGITAAIVGGRFEALRLWSDASGIAQWSGPPGRLRIGPVAAGGLIGPGANLVEDRDDLWRNQAVGEA